MFVFKPAIDNRYAEEYVVSHAGSQVKSISISKSIEILDYIDDSVDVVAIDEVQFFDEEVIFVCEYLTLKGLRVMVAGLDMDFRGNLLESFLHC